MGKLSRILIILAVLLTLAALVLSFLLFQRRNEFRNRAGDLATEISYTAKKLDQDSQTDVSKKVSFIPAEPITGAKESGTLSWKAYHDAKGEDGQYTAFRDTLKAAKLQVDAIWDQRNFLADTMAEDAGVLGLTEKDFAPAELKNLQTPEKYKQAAALVTSLAKATKTRDEDMIKKLLTAGSVIGHPLEESALRDWQKTVDEAGLITKSEFDSKKALDDFSTNITNLNTRAQDYAKTLTDAIEMVNKHQWQTNKALLSDEKEYAGAVTNMRNDFDDINKKLAELDETKVLLAEKTKALNETSDELFKTRAELEKKKQEIAEKLVEIEKWKKLAPGENTPGVTRKLPPNLKGTVVQVNRDWNFVILDLGADKINEKTIMLVSRGDKYVARVQVSKVFPHFSIAEVLPEIQIANINPNDTVILPRQ